MTLTYEEQEFVIVAIDENGKQYFIPKDEGNSDYQRYLNPVEHLTEKPTV